MSTRRRSVRVRIGLACAGLFLVTGAALITVTYGLLANGLAGSSETIATKSPDPLLLQHCKTDPLSDPNLAQKCKSAFSAGAAVGAKQQGSQALSQLLTYSIGGLAVLTVLAGVVGWSLAGRVLRPLHTITEAARRASEHNLTDRLALTGPRDELKEL
ncbi:MAG TPA: HAMP domain-containing protein, partial [Pseudonocardiaceae bacterium]|nr:HAMP domain-containing protein [Pseudonocardiaceae bacterium]